MTAIIVLVLLGILLFLIEFLIVPGITIAGIGAVILMASGVYLAFDNYGNQVGFFVLLATLFVSVVILTFALRAGTWKRIMLNTNIDGIANEAPPEDAIKPGDKGLTLTRLAPIGKIKVNDIVMEGKSVAGFVDPGVQVEIEKISGSQAIVKPLK
jgi:membrane-bound ClpP family serine protease